MGGPLPSQGDSAAPDPRLSKPMKPRNTRSTRKNECHSRISPIPRSSRFSISEWSLSSQAFCGFCGCQRSLGEDLGRQESRGNPPKKFPLGTPEPERRQRRAARLACPFFGRQSAGGAGETRCPTLRLSSPYHPVINKPLQR